MLSRTFRNGCLGSLYQGIVVIIPAALPSVSTELRPTQAADSGQWHSIAAALMRCFASNALRYATHGSPADVLRLERVRLPRVGPNDVLVEFLAVSA